MCIHNRLAWTPLVCSALFWSRDCAMVRNVLSGKYLCDESFSEIFCNKKRGNVPAELLEFIFRLVPNCIRLFHDRVSW
jgi:hypothetical protein